MSPDPLEKAYKSIFSLMSVHCQRMPDKLFVWLDAMSDHFRIIIIVSANHCKTTKCICNQMNTSAIFSIQHSLENTALCIENTALLVMCVTFAKSCQNKLFVNQKHTI